jgi:hypothetical protein
VLLAITILPTWKTSMLKQTKKVVGATWIEEYSDLEKDIAILRV